MHQIRVTFFGLLPKLDGLAGLLSALCCLSCPPRDAAGQPIEGDIHCLIELIACVICRGSSYPLEPTLLMQQ